MNYQKIYDSLIQKRIQNKLVKCGDGTIESHHIVPRCMGGTNSKSNIVNLYYKEHYVAHLLLTRIFKDTIYFEKLLLAIQLMSKSNGILQRNYISSKLYSEQRLQLVINNQKKAASKRAIKILWNGETHTFKEWGMLLGIPAKAIAHRYFDGWDVERIMTTPYHKVNKYIDFNGERLTWKQWSERLNISKENLHNRVYHLGWTIEDTLSTPKLSHSEKHIKREVFYNDAYYSIFELSKKFNIDYRVLHNRITNLKMPIEQALTQPIQKQYISFSYNGVMYESINEMLRDFNISPGSFYKQKNKGLTTEEAINKILQNKKVSA